MDENASKKLTLLGVPLTYVENAEEDVDLGFMSGSPRGGSFKADLNGVLYSVCEVTYPPAEEFRWFAAATGRGPSGFNWWFEGPFCATAEAAIAGFEEAAAAIVRQALRS